MKTYTVLDQNGDFVAAITQPERNRLRGCTEDGRAPRYDYLGRPVFNEALISVSRKRDEVYYVLPGVDPSQIRAEIGRSIANSIRDAEDNHTTRWEIWYTETNAGRYIEHNPRTCEAYGVRIEFLRDQIRREETRALRQATSKLELAHTKPKPVVAPLAEPKRKLAPVIPFPVKRTIEQPEELPQAA